MAISINLMLLLLPPDENFEVNLLFDGEKNPSQVFSELKGIFDALTSLDQLFVSNLGSELNFEYSLQNIEFGSIRMKLAQAIREIPDEAIKDFEWKKLIGHFLLRLKYVVLKYLEKTPQIDTKESIDALNEEIESSKTILFENEHRILTEVPNYFLLDALNQIVEALRQLKDGETLEFKTSQGAAKINNTVAINKAKILWELGDKHFENETTEILKIKKIDFLSNNSNWIFKLRNKTVDAKILDQDWLNKYHAREFPLLPEDSLKVKVKTSYVNKSDGKIIRPVYEITKVLDIIYPQDNQESIF